MVTDFHHDIGPGQIDADRQGLEAAINNLEASATTVLIVEDISRLGRDWATISKLLITLAAQNVAVHEACSGPFDMQRAVITGAIADALRQHRSAVIRRGNKARASARYRS